MFTFSLQLTKQEGIFFLEVTQELIPFLGLIRIAFTLLQVQISILL